MGMSMWAQKTRKRATVCCPVDEGASKLAETALLSRAPVYPTRDLQRSTVGAWRPVPIGFSWRGTALTPPLKAGPLITVLSQVCACGWSGNKTKSQRRSQRNRSIGGELHG